MEDVLEGIIRNVGISKDSSEISNYISSNYGKDALLWDKIVVYLDLRSRGKNPVISGNFIWLKDKGSNGYRAVIYVLTENQPINVTDLERILAMAKSLHVEVYISIVDKYGDITYYSIDETKLAKG
ncbi:MAG: tRNA-splicing endonuclease subunit beta [Candidatus Aramenus sulfurataquae]|jgi:tRNA-intron endonuclease|uniref:Ribonuclease BN n=2 Tax=Candidatus Aramenus sulfurataquae TaxID=1326980 RepID=W7KVH8_9CREN|nr:MAG: tRNA-splicing endonuclease subunit beta [Candidatus Aramenus sulfurataquae]MBW9140533.1 ribonuclease BN [Candidatus Aramenus sp.]MCL7343369.1 ribonuclease BN [Candidatus Aramenus sulfurataquae]